MTKDRLTRIVFFVIVALAILSAFFDTEAAAPTETDPVATESIVSTVDGN